MDINSTASDGSYIEIVSPKDKELNTQRNKNNKKSKRTNASNVYSDSTSDDTCTSHSESEPKTPTKMGTTKSKHRLFASFIETSSDDVETDEDHCEMVPSNEGETQEEVNIATNHI